MQLWRDSSRKRYPTVSTSAKMPVRRSHAPLPYSVNTHTLPPFSATWIFTRFISFGPVLYLTSTTAVITKKQKHKTLSAENVLEALEEVEFENFVEPLRTELETYRRANKEKKGTKGNGVKSGAVTSTDDPNNVEMDEE